MGRLKEHQITHMSYLASFPAGLLSLTQIITKIVNEIKPRSEEMLSWHPADIREVFQLYTRNE